MSLQGWEPQTRLKHQETPYLFNTENVTHSSLFSSGTFLELPASRYWSAFIFYPPKPWRTEGKQQLSSQASQSDFISSHSSALLTMIWLTLNSMSKCPSKGRQYLGCPGTAEDALHYTPCSSAPAWNQSNSSQPIMDQITHDQAN